MAYVTNIKTVITYDLDNATKTFTIPFEYLSRNFVVVTLIGQDRKILTNITDYTFSTSTQIITNSAWGDIQGYNQIEIRRQTSAQERIVDFQNGSVLRANDLNVSSIQSLHLAEEARDLVSDTIGADNEGNLDFRGRKGVNVADGSSDGDAVTVRQQKTWASSAMNQADRSKVEADRSTTAATGALVSESKSKSSENNASNSASSALLSENKSKTSEINAKNSEDLSLSNKNSAATSASDALISKNSAATSATNAELSALKAKNYAEVAGSIPPVGSILFYNNDTVNPNNQYPNTSWNKLEGNLAFRTASIGSVVGTIAGSDTVTLNINNIPAHSHTFSGNTSEYAFGTVSTSTTGGHVHTESGGRLAGTGGALASGSSRLSSLNTGYAGDHAHTLSLPNHSHSYSGTTTSIGSGAAFNVVPRHMVVIAWVRIA